MKYMILMYSDPASTKRMTTMERDVVGRKHQALVAELTESGELLSGAGLAYPEDTKTVRLQDGVSVVGDGPFVSAEEQLTAYYVVDCEGLDRAVSIAAQVLDFHVTTVEVRPVHDSVGTKGCSDDLMLGICVEFGLRLGYAPPHTKSSHLLPAPPVFYGNLP